MTFQPGTLREKLGLSHREVYISSVFLNRSIAIIMERYVNRYDNYGGRGKGTFKKRHCVPSFSMQSSKNYFYSEIVPISEGQKRSSKEQ